MVFVQKLKEVQVTKVYARVSLFVGQCTRPAGLLYPEP